MTDLERDLRDMLRERAGDIRTVPDHLLAPDDVPGTTGTDEVVDLGLHRNDVLAAARRRWPLLVAAAVVLAVLGGLLATLSGTGGHGDDHATHHRPRLKQVIRSSCHAAVPASWRHAVQQAGVALPSVGNDAVVAVTDDGGAVVERTGAAEYRIGYVEPGASSVRPLASFGVHEQGPGKVHSFGLDFDVTGRTLVVSVEYGRSRSPVRSIVAVNVDTGRRTVLADLPANSATSVSRPAYAQDGVAYWQVDTFTNTYPRTTSRIFARSVLGGPIRQVAPRGEYDLQKSALGVVWNLDSGSVDRPAAVPATVARTVTSEVLGGLAELSYVTDGHDWAWQTEQGGLAWFDPSTRRLVRVPGLLGRPDLAPGQAFVIAVAGPLVYYQDKAGNADKIIDVRTGAVLDSDGGDRLFGRLGTLVGSADNVGVQTAHGDLVRVRTADLPAAGC